MSCTITIDRQDNAVAAEPALLDTHSPLPWRAETFAGFVRVFNVSRLQHVAALPSTGPGVIKDAKSIVKAVNHHDALVQSLQQMVAAFEAQPAGGDDQSEALVRSKRLLQDLRGA